MEVCPRPNLLLQLANTCRFPPAVRNREGIEGQSKGYGDAMQGAG